MEADGRHPVACGWAVRFPREHVEEVARLWHVAGVEVFDAGADVWFRGQQLDPDIDAILRGFLSGKRFLVLADGQLQSPRELVPKGYLPDGSWVPLREWLRLEMPIAQLGGRLANRLTFRWVRSQSALEPKLMLADLADWTRYGTQAPEVRLRHLKFAQDQQGRVAICGSPLPPIPGERFAVYAPVAVPAGWYWSPEVDASVIAALLDIGPGDLAILLLSGEWEQIPANCFVAATRDAIRASAAAAAG